MSFCILFAFAICVVGFALLRTRKKASELSRLSWEDLLAKLEPVSNQGISLVALDYLKPTGGQLQLATTELWMLVGQDEGLRRMYANAQILIALAGYAQRWNPDESIIVAERMRRDGITLRRAALRLSVGVLSGRGNVLGPFNVQEAATAYYLMRERLLALYRTSHIARYPELAAVL